LLFQVEENLCESFDDIASDEIKGALGQLLHADQCDRAEILMYDSRTGDEGNFFGKRRNVVRIS
jgi:hypothetical protein